MPFQFEVVLESPGAFPNPLFELMATMVQAASVSSLVGGWIALIVAVGFLGVLHKNGAWQRALSTMVVKFGSVKPGE